MSRHPKTRSERIVAAFENGAVIDAAFRAAVRKAVPAPKPRAAAGKSALGKSSSGKPKPGKSARRAVRSPRSKTRAA